MKKLICLGCSVVLLIGMACTKNEPEPDSNQNNGQTGLTGNPTQDFPNNFRGSGDSANDLLSNTNFDRLEIEVAFVEGFRPTQAALDNLEDFIRELTFKENYSIVFTPLASPNEENLTLQEISDLEIDNRTSYNDGRTLAIYIYFADSPSEGDNLDEGLVTLGAVYRNTSMVIFESTIRDLASRSVLITNADIETATLNHEFGHLFGLVNLGTTPVNDHEDPEAENHCTTAGCLMRAELQFNATGKSTNQRLHSCALSANLFLKNLETRLSAGAAPPDLGIECRRDLENNGGRPTTASAKEY